MKAILISLMLGVFLLAAEPQGILKPREVTALAKSGETAAHCKYYAEHCRMAAKDMRALAAAHEEMAKGSGK